MPTRLQKKRWRVAREQGRPARMSGPEVEALAVRLRSLNARGMTYRAMSEQSGVPQSVISALVSQPSGITRRNYEPLSRVRFEEVEGFGARRSPLGTVRRIRALWAAGYPMAFLTEQLGGGEAQLCRALRGQLIRTHAEYATRIDALYVKMADVDPVEAGVSRQGAAYARNTARKRGYAPPHCWDPDTIDDPEAIPEWTGACGTATGLSIHRREGIPSCQPCRDVRERSDRPAPVERFSAERFRAVRERREISRQALAARLGVHEDTIQSWEIGRTSPRGDAMLDRLTVVLGCSHADIREEDE